MFNAFQFYSSTTGKDILKENPSDTHPTNGITFANSRKRPLKVLI